jgi:hypothetical protein
VRVNDAQVVARADPRAGNKPPACVRVYPPEVEASQTYSCLVPNNYKRNLLNLHYSETFYKIQCRGCEDKRKKSFEIFQAQEGKNSGLQHWMRKEYSSACFNTPIGRLKILAKDIWSISHNLSYRTLKSVQDFSSPR